MRRPQNFRLDVQVPNSGWLVTHAQTGYSTITLRDRPLRCSLLFTDHQYAIQVSSTLRKIPAFFVMNVYTHHIIAMSWQRKNRFPIPKRPMVVVPYWGTW